jgi:hypothetical protein
LEDVIHEYERERQREWGEKKRDRETGSKKGRRDGERV